MPTDAVLCVSCGFDLRTGKQLQTSKSGSPGSAAPASKPSKRRTPAAERPADEPSTRSGLFPVVLLCLGLLTLIGGAGWLVWRTGQPAGEQLNPSGPWTATLIGCSDDGRLSFAGLSAPHIQKIDGVAPERHFLSVESSLEEIPYWRAVPAGTVVTFKGRVSDPLVGRERGQLTEAYFSIHDATLTDRSVAQDVDPLLLEHVQILLAAIDAFEGKEVRQIPSVEDILLLLDPERRTTSSLLASSRLNWAQLHLGALKLLKTHGPPLDDSRAVIMKLLRDDLENTEPRASSHDLVAVCAELMATTPDLAEQTLRQVLAWADGASTAGMKDKLTACLRVLLGVHPRTAASSLGGDVEVTPAQLHLLLGAIGETPAAASELAGELLLVYRKEELSIRRKSLEILRELNEEGERIVPAILQYLESFASPVDDRLVQQQGEITLLKESIQSLGNYPGQSALSAPVLGDIAQRGFLPHWSAKSPFLVYKGSDGRFAAANAYADGPAQGRLEFDALEKVVPDLKSAASDALAKLGPAAVPGEPRVPSEPSELLEARKRSELGESFVQDKSGHQEPITQLAFSRDGARLASSSLDTTAKVWVADAMEVAFTLKSFGGHNERVNAVAFSSDDLLVATAGDDDIVKVWSAQDGSELLTLRDDQHYPQRDQRQAAKAARIACKMVATSFSPDGTIVLGVCHDGRIKSWNAQSGELLSSWKGFGARAQLAVFNGDASLVALASEERILLAEVENGKLRHRVQPAQFVKKDIIGMAFHPDRAILATLDDEAASVRIWDTASGKQLLEIQQDDNRRELLRSVAFSPDGDLLAGGGNGVVHIWSDMNKRLDGRPNSAKPSIHIEIEKDGLVQWLAFHPEGSHVAAAIDNEIVLVPLDGR